MTLKPSEFPKGKNPQATYAGDDVTTANDSETEACAVVGDGIHQGVTVLILATADVTTSANTSDVIAQIYERALGADTVGESAVQTVTAADEEIMFIMRMQQAYQTNPRYVLAITCTNATANATINNSCIAVIPIGG